LQAGIGLAEYDAENHAGDDGPGGELGKRHPIGGAHGRASYPGAVAKSTRLRPGRVTRVVGVPGVASARLARDTLARRP